MRLIFLGPPGAGKGTQTNAITAKHGIPAISTGDIIRATIREASPLAEACRSYTDKGLLVPDELVNEMVATRLAQPDCQGGFLLDGYPRTVEQAKELDRMLSSRGERLDHVLLLQVPDEVLVERIVGRRTDPDTGRVYHLTHDPPPPEVASRVVQRSDDTEEVLRARLAEYHEKTAALIPYYEKASLLRRVHGMGTMEEVRGRVLDALT